ncbi:MAG TPA: aminopeptidase P family protein [bacterium]|jgi:Xaa-Pro aminopeptidase|nr:aminopeptidase P family protein [bacterium]
MNPRLTALREKLKLEHLDAGLIFSEINRNYLTGFTGSSGALLVLPDQTLFITDSRYTLQAGRQVQGAKVLLQTRALLVDALEIIKKAKVKRVGFEAGHLTVSQHLWMLKQWPQGTWVPLQGTVESLRLVKDGGEKEALRKAGRVADQTFHHILPFIKVGAVERDLASEMEHFMRRQGADGPSFETIVASGWRSALPHGIASAKRLEKGDFIVFDFGCRLDGYCSDMTRTVCVGPASAFQRKIYGIVQKAQAAGLRAIRPGQTTGAVDLAARSVIGKAGYASRFGHGTGHGVGREVHEDPRVGPKAKDLLWPGMAITCEPGIYLEGKFGVRIEDLALVTETGHENLYRTTKNLITV